VCSSPPASAAVSVGIMTSRRLRRVCRHLVPASHLTTGQAAVEPLAGLDRACIASRFKRDGFVVVRSFLQGIELARAREELSRYIRDVIPTKDPASHYFDGEWSAEGSRGPVWALKYINEMDELPFFRDFSKGRSQVAHPRWHAMAQLLTGAADVECRGCEAFNKPPGLSTPTPPHQDNFCEPSISR
jgi:hypothetical protein